MNNDKKPWSLFGCLFGGLASGEASQEYIEALHRANEYLIFVAFETAATINDWIN